MLRGDGDPVAASLVRALKRRDLAEVRSTLADYEGHDRSLLLVAVSEHGSPAYRWLRGDPRMGEDEALDRLLLGSLTIGCAWRERTNARAQRVSPQKFAIFHTLLREAEEHLYAVAELEPSWAEPWSLLITSGRGLQRGIEINQRRFEAAVMRCPGHRVAHEQMLQTLCRKWSGSHERMHAFAAEAARGPYQSTLAHLVAIAHLEHRLDMKGGGSARRPYMKQQEVRAELKEAAELSIFSVREADPRSPYFDANVFAMAFNLAGMYSEAKRAFELTNGVVTRFPWQYGNSRDLVTTFAHQRRRARFSRATS